MIYKLMLSLLLRRAQKREVELLAEYNKLDANDPDNRWIGSEMWAAYIDVKHIVHSIKTIKKNIGRLI